MGLFWWDIQVHKLWAETRGILHLHLYFNSHVSVDLLALICVICVYNLCICIFVANKTLK